MEPLENEPVPPRLPGWAFAVIAAGGVATYFAVGMLLEGARFLPGFQSLLEDPAGFIGGTPEVVAPFVLLLIPAVLGALGTREMLRIVFGGIRDGNSPETVVKALGKYLAGILVLVMLALYSSGVGRR